VVKEIIFEPGRTFSEFSLMTGYTMKNNIAPIVNLVTDLAGLQLKIPMLSAAMTAVTGYEMALALGKEGGIGILPSRLHIREQVRIIKEIKNYEMSFVEEPLKIRETSTVEHAMNMITRRGHSKVPVVDRNNVFLGMFTQENYWKSKVSYQDKVTEAMIKPEEIACHENQNVSLDEAKQLLEKKKANYLVILDGQKRLVKLAFKKDIEKIKIGAAISTHEGWEERVKSVVEAGADLIVVDTSDAYNEFVVDVLKKYKSMNLGIPICAGNIITEEGALFLMENGADMVKVGMSSGSICTTQREKAVGRAPMSALMAAEKARKKFLSEKGKYVPIIMDGGIASASDMVIALSIADALMMGGYFNRFYESPAEKFNENGKETRDEREMKWVSYWGEGSEKAMNLGRYGHLTRKTFFAEGVEGKVPYMGRLKPTLKKDLMKIKAALSNAGCRNLVEYRENAVLELISPHSSIIISNPHNIKENI